MNGKRAAQHTASVCSHTAVNNFIDVIVLGVKAVGYVILTLLPSYMRFSVWMRVWVGSNAGEWMRVSAHPCHLAWLHISRGMAAWCSGRIFGAQIRWVKVQFPPFCLEADNVHSSMLPQASATSRGQSCPLRDPPCITLVPPPLAVTSWYPQGLNH